MASHQSHPMNSTSRSAEPARTVRLMFLNISIWAPCFPNPHASNIALDTTTECVEGRNDAQKGRDHNSPLLLVLLGPAVLKGWVAQQASPSFALDLEFIQGHGPASDPASRAAGSSSPAQHCPCTPCCRSGCEAATVSLALPWTALLSLGSGCGGWRGGGGCYRQQRPVWGGLWVRPLQPPPAQAPLHGAHLDPGPVLHAHGRALPAGPAGRGGPCGGQPQVCRQAHHRHQKTASALAATHACSWLPALQLGMYAVITCTQHTCSRPVHAGGAFSVMRREAVRRLIEIAHEHDVTVSTGVWIEYVLSQVGRGLPLGAQRALHCLLRPKWWKLRGEGTAGSRRRGQSCSSLIQPAPCAGAGSGAALPAGVPGAGV